MKKRLIIIIFIVLVFAGIAIYLYIDHKKKANYEDVSNQFDVILNDESAKQVANETIKEQYSANCTVQSVQPSENKIVVNANCPYQKEIILVYKDSKWTIEK
ncbi:MAG: hypothetical protein K5666_01080 [Bacilli bacterium]|nr:hypothetical protein [Bacilli bacterium]